MDLVGGGVRWRGGAGLGDDVMGPDDEYCEGCENVPAKGYWLCPVCDAEWPDEGRRMTEPEYLERLAAQKRAIANGAHQTSLISDAITLEAAAADLRAGLHREDGV